MFNNFFYLCSTYETIVIKKEMKRLSYNNTSRNNDAIRIEIVLTKK